MPAGTTSPPRADARAQVVKLAGLHEEVHRFGHQQAKQPGDTVGADLLFDQQDDGQSSPAEQLGDIRVSHAVGIRGNGGWG